MLLTVTGLDSAPIRFRHLWDRYVHCFRPWTHCIACFACTKAKGVLPTMRDGDYELEDKLFYLCGVGQKVSEHLYPQLARRVAAFCQEFLLFQVQALSPRLIVVLGPNALVSLKAFGVSLSGEGNSREKIGSH